jgi:hypothetical protein
MFPYSSLRSLSLAEVAPNHEPRENKRTNSNPRHTQTYDTRVGHSNAIATSDTSDKLRLVFANLPSYT